MKPVHIEMPEAAATPATYRDAFMAASRRSARKIAVLGDMPGLGADELAQHADLAPHIVEAGFARVFTVGECMRALRGALPRSMRAAHADSPDLIEDTVRAELAEGDYLLVKGWDDQTFGALIARLQGAASDEGRADHVV